MTLNLEFKRQVWAAAEEQLQTKLKTLEDAFRQSREDLHSETKNLISINSLGFRPLRNSEFRLQVRQV